MVTGSPLVVLYPDCICIYHVVNEAYVAKKHISERGKNQPHRPSSSA